MGPSGAEAVGGIEGDPAELGHEGFRPGMAALLLVAGFAVEVAADIARRNAQTTRGGNEDMREVLSDAAFARERLGGPDCSMARSGVVDHVLVQPRQHVVQEVERAAARRTAACDGTAMLASMAVSAVSRR